LGSKRPRKTKTRHASAAIPAEFPASVFVPVGSLLARIAAPPREKDGPPCHFCSALCCKYFAIQIDRPKTPREHDEVRWYLYHENVVVWVDDGDWYLEVRTRCRNLQADNSCGIYDTRPLICRDYGLPSEGPCEYFTQDTGYDMFFGSAQEFEAWSLVDLEKRRVRLERQRAKRKQGSRSREPVGV